MCPTTSSKKKARVGKLTFCKHCNRKILPTLEDAHAFPEVHRRLDRSSSPYFQTTILLMLLAWLIGGGVASLRQRSMGQLVLAIGMEHYYWLKSNLADTALLRENS
ncbi:hypothetical protein TNCV_772341 [Trichonephila clavipes]|nr:hypothetical protein TNCV_772341 [Trichonephila clavipes]